MAKERLDTPYDLSGKRIFIAGHGGMVGAALLRRLKLEQCQILTASREDLDLTNQASVNAWMANNKPDTVVIAAAKVGGILANSTYPAQFFYDNIMINTNIMHAAHENKVSRLLALGSSCIYPRECTQPMREDMLLGGALEPTNEAYALAKIAALKMAQYYRAQYGCDFISAMPCNLFGVGDRYDEQNSHVIPALIMRAHAAKLAGAKELSVWGSGEVLREFMDVDDLADALVFLLRNYGGDTHINVGSGYEITIKKLAEIICEVVGFEGKITFDVSKPDGVARKGMDNIRLVELGWAPEMCQNSDANMSEKFKNGIKKCYADFLGDVIEDDSTRRHSAGHTGRQRRNRT